MPSTTRVPESLGGLDLELAGVAARLLARRAIWWPDEATLFVADVHLGKAETFRALGVPVPAGPTEATLRRLGARYLERAQALGRQTVLRLMHGLLQTHRQLRTSGNDPELSVITYVLHAQRLTAGGRR